MVNHSWLWILRNGCHHSSWQRISFVIYGSPHQGHRNNWAWGQCDQLDDKETTQTATRSRQTSFRDSRLRSLNVQLDKSSSARNKRENWWTGSDHAFDIGKVQVIDASFLLRASVSSFIALLKNAEWQSLNSVRSLIMSWYSGASYSAFTSWRMGNAIQTVGCPGSPSRTSVGMSLKTYAWVKKTICSTQLLQRARSQNNNLAF